MNAAMIAIQNKELGWLKASKKFSIPQATLRCRCKNKNKVAKGVVKVLGRPTFLSHAEDSKLVDHILDLES